MIGPGTGCCDSRKAIQQDFLSPKQKLGPASWLAFSLCAEHVLQLEGERRAGQRVMESVTHFITHRLKLKVNQAKSAVARPGQRKFLGFSFTGEREPRRRIAPKAMARFKERIREQTRRTRGISLAQMVKQIVTYLRGWLGYFGDGQTPSGLQSLESWLRHRFRSVVWKQWKRGRTRFRELRERGISKDLAAKTAGSPHGPWRIANSPALACFAECLLRQARASADGREVLA
jgi:RNA-directed DNA polymerase